jgi:hypothetical protein
MEIAVCALILWLGLATSKFYGWQTRDGKVNEHNAWIPRDFWLEAWEKQAIIEFPDPSIRADRSGCVPGDGLIGAYGAAPNRRGRSASAAKEFAPARCEFWLSSRHAQRTEAVSD